MATTSDRQDTRAAHLSLALAGGLLLAGLLREGDAERPHRLPICIFPELHIILWEALLEVVRIKERVLQEAGLIITRLHCHVVEMSNVHGLYALWVA